MSSQETDLIATLKWTPDGLIPAIVQDAENHEVLMMAWMDVVLLRQTLATGQTHFYSRQARAAPAQGGTSRTRAIRRSRFRIDCDADVVLIKARQVGGASLRRLSLLFLPSSSTPTAHFQILDSPVFEKTSVYGSQPEKSRKSNWAEPIERETFWKQVWVILPWSTDRASPGLRRRPAGPEFTSPFIAKGRRASEPCSSEDGVFPGFPPVSPKTRKP